MSVTHGRRMRTAMLLALLALLALPAVLYPQDMGFPSLPMDAAPGTGVAEPCVPGPVDGRARCGVFRVLADRSDTAAGTIDIAFVVLEALDAGARATDAVILLPGGPGQAFTHTAVPNARRLAELRRQRDIVLVDVRGTGRSGGLSCDVAYPRGFASRFGALFPLDHIAACRDALSRRTRLNLYTTAASVDDLDELRRWLGYTANNLLGTSYGTRVAQVYMRRHPDAVRVVVLNGVASVAEPLYVQHAFLLQRALERLLGECRADAECRSAFPDLDDRLARVFARVREAPVPLEVRGSMVQFNPGDLGYALRGLLYARGADVPRLIHEAADGRIQPLAEYYADRTDTFSSPDGYAGYHFSVLCAEDIAPLTDDHVARATAGTFLGDYLIESYRAACRIWPYARLPAPHWTPVQSGVPTLLLSGGRDPVTPPETAEAVASHLSNSVHVIVPNGGHGVGGACVERMIAHVVATGTVEGLDLSCVDAVPPTRFARPDGE